MTEASIRPACAGDTDAIVSLLGEMHTQHLAWDAACWMTSQSPQATYAGWIAELISRPADGTILVAELQGNIAGYVLAEVEAESTRHWSPRSLYVHDLFVASHHRRAGIARALMQALTAWADATHPGVQLRLMTAIANEPARAFFAALGFRACIVAMIRP